MLANDSGWMTSQPEVTFSRGLRRRLYRSRLRGSEKPVYFLSARAPISRAKLRLMIGAAIKRTMALAFLEKWLHLCSRSRVAGLRTFCIMLRNGIEQFVGSWVSESGYHLRIKKVRKGRASVDFLDPRGAPVQRPLHGGCALTEDGRALRRLRPPGFHRSVCLSQARGRWQ